jgi:hypothetical protein
MECINSSIDLWVPIKSHDRIHSGSEINIMVATVHYAFSELELSGPWDGHRSIIEVWLLIKDMTIESLKKLS